MKILPNAKHLGSILDGAGKHLQISMDPLPVVADQPFTCSRRRFPGLGLTALNPFSSWLL